jgi:hypothetical protein
LSSESEARKSRAKGIILDSQTVSRWTTSVVPIFTYWYLFELDAWPTTAAIGNCAQQIWDWRFGEMYPLDFKKSPSHVQLVSFSFHLESELLTPSQLNQKLCEIRSFLASLALANLDTEFQLANKDTFELSEEDIQILRREYAQELFANKLFIFGKCTIDGDGVVCTLSPFIS